MNKNIINISNPKYYHMVGDGFRVHNLLPGYGEQMSNRSSPFLMLDYNSPWPIPGDGVRRGV
jgi:quercetin 2,3-dioxygenase